VVDLDSSKETRAVQRTLRSCAIVLRTCRQRRRCIEFFDLRLIVDRRRTLTCHTDDRLGIVDDIRDILLLTIGSFVVQCFVYCMIVDARMFECMDDCSWWSVAPLQSMIAVDVGGLSAHSQIRCTRIVHDRLLIELNRIDTSLLTPLRTPLRRTMIVLPTFANTFRVQIPQDHLFSFVVRTVETCVRLRSIDSMNKPSRTNAKFLNDICHVVFHGFDSLQNLLCLFLKPNQFNSSNERQTNERNRSIYVFVLVDNSHRLIVSRTISCIDSSSRSSDQLRSNSVDRTSSYDASYFIRRRPYKGNGQFPSVLLFAIEISSTNFVDISTDFGSTLDRMLKHSERQLHNMSLTLTAGTFPWARFNGSCRRLSAYSFSLHAGRFRLILTIVTHENRKINTMLFLSDSYRSMCQYLFK
jgi:hypothetical protein